MKRRYAESALRDIARPAFRPLVRPVRRAAERPERTVPCLPYWQAARWRQIS
jgi:hypothetical protein